MGRILVYPEELEAISSQVGKAMAELQALRDRLGSQLGSLNWETHHRALVEQLMGQAGQMAGSVAHAGEQMAAFLKKKAGDFVAADEGGAAGNHRAPDPSMALANAVRTSGLEDAGIAAVTGVAAAAAVPLVTNPGWVKQKYGPQFGGSPTTGDQRDPGVPAGVAAHPPADPFTAVVGAVPVVTVGGVKQFSPAFQQWADSFNRRVRAVWEGKATDHAGTSAERLVETYQLTPEKAEKIWTVAAANHVDPKLLLAILQQEGTGSFNTNPGNTAYYDGHGPQPDFDADLQAALTGRSWGSSGSIRRRWRPVSRVPGSIGSTGTPPWTPKACRAHPAFTPQTSTGATVWPERSGQSTRRWAPARATRSLSTRSGWASTRTSSSPRILAATL